MRLWLLLLADGVVIGLAAAAVRCQLALFSGFDLGIAVAVLLAAETGVAVANVVVGGLGWDAILSCLAALLVGATFMVAWNLTLEGLRARRGGAAPTFVISLGAVSVVAGGIGLLRGPGLRSTQGLGSVELASGRLSLSVVLACLVGVGAIFILLSWARKGSGLALELLGQDREFALEIGVESRELLVASGVAVGLSLGFVGWHYAWSSGSTPVLGFTTFLMATGGALLLPGKGLKSAVLGGILVGGARVLLEVLVDPVSSNALVFLAVFGLLLARGTSRTAQGAR